MEVRGQGSPPSRPTWNGEDDARESASLREGLEPRGTERERHENEGCDREENRRSDEEHQPLRGEVAHLSGRGGRTRGEGRPGRPGVDQGGREELAESRRDGRERPGL